jgi:hypothetical protein
MRSVRYASSMSACIETPHCLFRSASRATIRFRSWDRMTCNGMRNAAATSSATCSSVIERYLASRVAPPAAVIVKSHTSGNAPRCRDRWTLSHGPFRLALARRSWARGAVSAARSALTDECVVSAAISHAAAAASRPVSGLRSCRSPSGPVPRPTAAGCGLRDMSRCGCSGRCGERCSVRPPQPVLR